MESADKKKDEYAYLYNLEEKISSLQVENKMLEDNSEYLRSQLNLLRNEIARLKRLPLIIGDVIDKMDEDKVIVKNTNGMSFLVSCTPELMKDVELGSKVGLHQQTLNVIKVLPKSNEYFIAGAEVIEKPNINYKDIGGLSDQIIEIKETVELPMKNPKIFKEVGIDPPSGVLLFGPPGCGKTLLAKAVAKETDATFIKLVGSELVQKFIGEGTKLVKSIFSLARDKSPAILFIDEIDAVGSKRLEETTGGDREVNRTLMQLLAEMDGFQNNSDVKIIAATNRIDILDPALLRPGRFDRIIEVPLPEEKGREEIFKIHLRRMSTKADPKALAKKTDGAVGAEIKAICTEAGMFAIRDKRKIVEKKDFEKAIKKVLGEDEAAGEEHRLYM